MKQGYVYIMSNVRRSVLYIGVTSNLEHRVYQHKHKVLSGFSAKYNCMDLVWWELGESIESAISREKQLKGWSRAKKDALIFQLNPNNIDLARKLFGWV